MYIDEYYKEMYYLLTNDALRCRLEAAGMKDGPLGDIIDRSLVLVGLGRGPSV